MLSVCYLVRLDGWFCSHHYCIWLVSSDTQGCLLTSHRDSLCLWSVWRHLLTRLITLSDKFRCSNQVSAPDLILVYVWKGMSPHSMSYNKMPSAQGPHIQTLCMEPLGRDPLRWSVHSITPYFV